MKTPCRCICCPAPRSASGHGISPTAGSGASRPHASACAQQQPQPAPRLTPQEQLQAGLVRSPAAAHHHPRPLALQLAPNKASGGQHLRLGPLQGQGQGQWPQQQQQQQQQQHQQRSSPSQQPPQRSQVRSWFLLTAAAAAPQLSCPCLACMARSMRVECYHNVTAWKLPRACFGPMHPAAGLACAARTERGSLNGLQPTLGWQTVVRALGLGCSQGLLACA